MNNIEKFIEAYKPQYGADTTMIIESLMEHEEKVALINPFIPEENITSYIDAPITNFLGQKICQSHLKPERIDSLLSHYFLDRSSLLAPSLLPQHPGSNFLDMCSAPGGKLLASVFLRVKNVSFVANDLSHARAHRLKKVVKDYLPNDIALDFAAKDASLIGLKQPEHYDAVLLDAPCSSEAHLIKNPTLLNQFSGLRKNLPHRQYALLCSALMATKKNGFIMYSTCSINKNENEEIIKRVLKKKGDLLSLVPLKTPLGNITPWGVEIMPHKDKAGPAFLSLLQKI
ncbi:MAG: hypothetical protein KC505_05640 [Myxococcales bacterium]|nr:hypothetical protein [Myxococcales bacterium]USN51745.1 MAG: hypothetical protein H6731_04880 [Myxococcales bacterium]